MESYEKKIIKNKISEFSTEVQKMLTSVIWPLVTGSLGPAPAQESAQPAKPSAQQAHTAKNAAAANSNSTEALRATA